MLAARLGRDDGALTRVWRGGRRSEVEWARRSASACIRGVIAGDWRGGHWAPLPLVGAAVIGAGARMPAQLSRAMLVAEDAEHTRRS
jgi:hypothetical protein